VIEPELVFRDEMARAEEEEEVQADLPPPW